MAGNPARLVGSYDDYVAKLSQRTASMPWRDVIAQREGGFDPKVEPMLREMRVTHFFGSNEP
jgi:hypothetical protein